MIRLVAAMACLTVLASCASVSREECLVGDWASIGQRDGEQGRAPETQFARHVSACAKVDVAPDPALWQQGYDQGLRSYCTPLSGLRRGEAGQLYRNVCPATAEAGFLEGYELGQRAFRQRERIREIEREISQIRQRNLFPDTSGEGDGDDALRHQWQADQGLLLSLRLDLTIARAELNRIERDIRAFRATLRSRADLQ